MNLVDNFCHCHVHTSYSLLDGLSSPEKLITRAAELGQPGIAITDHGNLHGVIDFYREAKKHNLVPIIGYEGYICGFGASMHTKDTSNRENFHMLLLAENEEGYKNLRHLSSAASIQGFYNRPRFDFNMLEQHKDGIITTTGCMAAPIPRLIGQQIKYGGMEKRIEQLFEWHIDVFGKDNFFVEIQDHIGIPELDDINYELLHYGYQYGLKFLLTNDAHYANPQDAIPHDVLLCVQTNSKVWQQNRMRFTDNEYYLKSRSEMEKISRKYALDDSCLDLSLEIMERCKGLDLESKQKHHMPHIDIPSEYVDYDSYLKDLTIKGMDKKYGKIWRRDQGLVDRAKNELEVISSTGFAVYYLIIKDIIDFAADRGIIWNVRGSGAGSIVSYAINLSFVDPARYGLVFERFINPERVSIPDMDLDFPDNTREEIIHYLINKYGEAQVAQIVTFGRMKARLCIRDTARAHGWEQAKIDSLAGKIMNTPGKPITIENSLDPDSEYYSSFLAKAYKDNRDERDLLDLSKQIENTVRHTGVHAAAVAIGDRPLIDYVPLMRSTATAITNHITQFDYPTLESLGLLKVDILGLATLSIIRETCKLVKDRHGVDIDYEKIPFEEGDIQDSLALLASGEVKGVFQVESHGLRQILMQLKPTTFEQIMDVISLYRPGPIDYIPQYINRTWAREEVEYSHDSLADILAPTQGIMIYQEQIIRILRKMGGYSLGEADIIRKAISKKDVKKIGEEKVKFIEKAQKIGYTADEALKVFNDIEKFALYGFNLAHAASYARMTMVTAWLKVNYPAEFMLSCLIVEKNKPEKVTGYILEARRMGIDVLTPDIQRSDYDFTLVDNHGKITSYSKYGYNIDREPAILFGLKSIKHVGDDLASMIVQRGKNIKVLDDILSLDYSKINARSLRRLIGAGLFDKICDRNLLFGNEEAIIQAGKSAEDFHRYGQSGFILPVLNIEQVEKADILSEEKESLGVWLTGHPLEQYYYKLDHVLTHNIHDATSGESVFNCMMILIVDEIKDHTTKNGDPMAFVTFSDIYGTIQGMMFSNVYELYRDMLHEDKPIIVAGRVSYYRQEPTLIIDSLHTKANNSGVQK